MVLFWHLAFSIQQPMTNDQWPEARSEKREANNSLLLQKHYGGLPSDFEQKLGFDSIRKLIRDHCLCFLGQKFADGICFSAELSEIEQHLNETEELRQIMMLKRISRYRTSMILQRNLPGSGLKEPTSNLKKWRCWNFPWIQFLPFNPLFWDVSPANIPVFQTMPEVYRG